jgi:hypothetical protein
MPFLETLGNASSRAYKASGVKPDAPVLGTVTVGSSTSVSIPFTVNSYGLPLTAVNVTSSPSLSLGYSGTTSPLTVTGSFASDQAYTFQMTATNAVGTSAASSASNSVNPNPLAFQLISTQILGSTTNTVTFSSIPQNYKHLQLRITARSDIASDYAYYNQIQTNGVTSGYTWRSWFMRNANPLYDNGGATTTSLKIGEQIYNGSASNIYSSNIIDLFNYSNTTVSKAIRAMSGGVTTVQANSSVIYSSGYIPGTSAISSIAIFPNSGNYVAGSRFSLYGVAG